MELNFTLTLYNKSNAEHAALQLRALVKMCEDLVASLPEPEVLQALTNPKQGDLLVAAPRGGGATVNVYPNGTTTEHVPTQTELDLGAGPDHPSSAGASEPAEPHKPDHPPAPTASDAPAPSEKPQEKPKRKRKAKAKADPDPSSTDAPAKTQEANGKVPTPAELRMAMGRVLQAKGADRVKEMLEEYGVQSVPQVREEDRGALLANAIAELDSDG